MLGTLWTIILIIIAIIVNRTVTTVSFWNIGYSSCRDGIRKTWHNYRYSVVNS